MQPAALCIVVFGVEIAKAVFKGDVAESYVCAEQGKNFVGVYSCAYYCIVCGKFFNYRTEVERKHAVYYRDEVKPILCKHGRAAFLRTFIAFP